MRGLATLGSFFFIPARGARRGVCAVPLNGINWMKLQLHPDFLEKSG